MLCFDSKKGTKIATYRQNYTFLGTPCLLGTYIYAGTDRGSLECIDPRSNEGGFSGQSTGRILASPVVSDGTLYAATDTGLLHSIKAREGWENWWYQAGAGIVSTPAIAGNIVIVGCLNGYVIGISWSGTVVWQFKDSGPISGSVSIDNDKFFVGSQDGTLFCRKVIGGTIIWKESFKGKILSTPAIKNGNIYFGVTDGNFYCYTVDGTKKWSFETGGAIEGNCTIAGDVCYFGSGDGKVYAIDINNGRQLWSYNIENPIKTTPTVAENSVFVNATDGYIYCFTEGGSESKPRIEKITVFPGEMECEIGESYNFTAKAYDKNNTEIPGVDFKWYALPDNIGKITSSGEYIPSKPGKCTISASADSKTGSAYVTNKIKIYVDKIKIEPSNAIIESGKTFQFSAAAIDNTGASFPKPKLSWSCDPSELGAIDDNGLFVAGKSAMEGKVIVAGYGKYDFASVTVKEERKAIISIEDPVLSFPEADPQTNINTSLYVSNKGNIPDEVEITTDTDWITIISPRAVIEPKTKVEIGIIISGKPLFKNASLQGSIKVKGSDSEIFVVSVKIQVNSGIVCFVTDEVLDFGKVSRGTAKTMVMKVRFTGYQAGKIVSNAPWLTISPDTFTNVRNLDVKVTIDGSSLPAGDSFEDFIEFVGDVNCRETRVKVKVLTEKNIWIKLTLGSPIVEINGLAMTLATPPVKIKGVTMVPIRFISEAFGCKVDWDANEKKITITRGTKIIVLYLDKKDAYINGQKVTMTAPPTSVNGKTVVPVRFIAETFGAKVNFDAGTGVITIEYTPN